MYTNVPPQFHDLSVEGLKVILPEDAVTIAWDETTTSIIKSINWY